MAITLKNEEEIELMRKAGQMLARVHIELARELKEGMTTKDVDRLAEEMILSFGGYPNFKGYNGFPAAACVSVNDEVVHGIPSDKRYLRNGDIVSIDTGVLYKGYHSDAARTHAIGEVDEDVKKLIRVTEDSFFAAIKKAKPGNHIVDIGQVVQRYALNNGYSVVRTLTGHGIGTDLHEAPNVPNYKTIFKGPLLRKGMTLAVEPMINMGNYDVDLLENNWTYATSDGTLSSHYENTIAITDEGCEILTLTPEEIAARLEKKDPEPVKKTSDIVIKVSDFQKKTGGGGKKTGSMPTKTRTNAKKPSEESDSRESDSIAKETEEITDEQKNIPEVSSDVSGEISGGQKNTPEKPSETAGENAGGQKNTAEISSEKSGEILEEEKNTSKAPKKKFHFKKLHLDIFEDD